MILLKPNYPPTAPPPNTITLGLGLLRMSEGTHIQSMSPGQLRLGCVVIWVTAHLQTLKEPQRMFVKNTEGFTA